MSEAVPRTPDRRRMPATVAGPALLASALALSGCYAVPASLNPGTYVSPPDTALHARNWNERAEDIPVEDRQYCYVTLGDEVCYTEWQIGEEERLLNPQRQSPVAGRRIVSDQRQAISNIRELPDRPTARPEPEPTARPEAIESFDIGPPQPAAARFADAPEEEPEETPDQTAAIDVDAADDAIAAARSDFYSAMEDALGGDERYEVQDDSFIIPLRVLFDTNSAALRPGVRPELNEVARLIQDLEDEIPGDVEWVLRIDGHADQRPVLSGPFRSNWELSTARALSVLRYLEGQGVPPRRLAAAGFGDTRPLVEGDDPASLEQNRRIELTLTRP